MTAIKMVSAIANVRSVYFSYCKDVRRRYELNQTAFDIIMFIANNPENNTARDICKVRNIKSGIVSVTVESLIRNGYLTRRGDNNDRRLQRLYVTEKAFGLIREGREAQKKFGEVLFSGFTQDEAAEYIRLTDKLVATIEDLSKDVLNK